MHAAAIHPQDVRLIQGDLRRLQRVKFPVVPGCDVSGVIVAAGHAAGGLEPGMPVFASIPRHRLGAFAEYVAVAARHVAVLPAGLSHRQAASLPLSGLVCVQALLDRAHSRPGQSILIHGGAGGVGSFAIQLAKRVLGLEVTTTTSSANAELCRELGADRVIAYDRENYLAGGKHFDIIYDTLGGRHATDAFRVVRSGGAVVSIAGPPDPECARQMDADWVSRLAMYGHYWWISQMARQRRASYHRFLAEPSGAQLRAIGSIVESGQIKPVIDRIFAFDDIVHGLHHVSKGRAKGRTLVRFRT